MVSCIEWRGENKVTTSGRIEAIAWCKCVPVFSKFAHFMSYSKETLIPLLRHSIRVVDPGARAYLFGSRARGDFSDESDWDVIIITQTQISAIKEMEFRKALYQLSLNSDELISTFVFDQEHWNKNYSLANFRNAVMQEMVLIC